MNTTTNPAKNTAKTGTSAGPDGAGELGEEYRTRPGTPMIDGCSTNQMDDFYRALSYGQVKPTGIMNYAQRLYIADRCEPGAHVVDVCCGRGLQLPVLYRYAPHLGGYVGFDLAEENLAEARQRIRQLDHHYEGRPFDIDLGCHDVAKPWPPQQTPPGGFDVAVYTSAFEHLPRDRAVASLRHTAQALAPGGRLYLSTPNTPGAPPRRLQHRVHVYEWNDDELTPVLRDCGLSIDERIGLLPPAHEQLAETITDTYGADAERWYRRLRELVPHQLLDTMSAAAFPADATELLYVCRRQP